MGDEKLVKHTDPESGVVRVGAVLDTVDEPEGHLHVKWVANGGESVVDPANCEDVE